MWSDLEVDYVCRDVERGERKRNEIGVVVDLRLGGG